MNAAVRSAFVDATNSAVREAEAGGDSGYLVPLANRPVLVHVIEELADAGVERVRIAASAGVREQIEPWLSEPGAPRVSTSFLVAEVPLSATALAEQLRELDGDGPVVCQFGDCLFAGRTSQLVNRALEDDLDLALLVQSSGRRLAPADPAVNSARRPRLPRERPEGGAVVIGKSAWPRLDRLADQPFSISRLLESTAHEQISVGTYEVSEHWCYAHCPERLLAGNRMVLDALAATANYLPADCETRSEGRVSVAGSARVERSTLRGPIVIGPGAVIEDSFVGPYTAIGPEAIVLGAELDYSIVMRGAEIRHPGQRLYASVIGECSRVSQSFTLPPGLHLRIGSGATVELG